MCSSDLNDTPLTPVPDNTSIDWNDLGSYFDTVIYPRITDKFSTPLDVDNNNQVVILFYTLNSAQSNIGGYFWSGDLFLTTGSNQMELLYMNKSLFNTSTQAVKDTIAHEFQHLVNASQKIRIGEENNASAVLMDTWMDEGLAECAADYSKDSVLTEHVNNFKNDTSHSFRNGFPLVKWEYDFDNYTLSYLFFQYCQLQSDNTIGIYKQLINHTLGDYRAVEAVVGAQNTQFNTFSDIFSTFRAANLAQQSTGIYGYSSRSGDFNFGPLKNASQTVSSLKSGGGIALYPSQSNLSNFTPDSGIDERIQYLRINGSNNQSSHAQLTNLSIAGYTGEALLVLNTSGDASVSGVTIGTVPTSNSPQSREIVTSQREARLLRDIPFRSTNSKTGMQTALTRKKIYPPKIGRAHV